ncbi:MAG: GNAT family N-acetyltransferase, partial [Chloroflexota bacterium]
QKESFLQQQFAAQALQYQKNYPQGQHDLILLNGGSIGRIYTAEGQNELQLLDILLAPEARNQGVGSHFMTQLKGRARQASKPLRFYVWQLNHAAQRFYERHNCYVTHEAGAYLHMEWKPE